jgi:hypothetical protein
MRAGADAGMNTDGHQGQNPAAENSGLDPVTNKQSSFANESFKEGFDFLIDGSTPDLNRHWLSPLIPGDYNA